MDNEPEEPAVTPAAKGDAPGWSSARSVDAVTAPADPPAAARPVEEIAGEVADRWIDAWTGGRTSALFRLLAAGVVIESNLDPDGDFIEILGDFAGALSSVSVSSRTVIRGRVALLYDCVAGGEAFRLAEFLDVDAEGLVREVRRVYDLSAVQRLLPGLLAGS